MMARNIGDVISKLHRLKPTAIFAYYFAHYRSATVTCEFGNTIDTRILAVEGRGASLQKASERCLEKALEFVENGTFASLGIPDGLDSARHRRRNKTVKPKSRRGGRA